MRAACLSALVSLFLAIATSPAPAQIRSPLESEPGGAAAVEGRTSEDPLATIEARRAALSQRLGVLEEAERAAEQASVLAELSDERRVLERTDRLLARQRAAVQRGGELSRSRDQLDRRATAEPGESISEPPPFRLALLDALRGVHAGHERNRLALEEALAAAEGELKAARSERKRRESARRQAKEAAGEADDDEVDRARARRELDRAEQESNLAATRLVLAELELSNAVEAVALQRQHSALVEATVTFVESHLGLSEDDLAEPLEAIEKRAFALDAALERARREHELAGSQARALEEWVAKLSEPDSATRARLEATRLALRVAERRVELLDDQLQRLAGLEDQWELRYRTLSGEASREELAEWEDQLASSLEDRGRRRLLEEARLAEIRNELANARERRQHASGAGPTEAKWLEAQGQELELLVGLFEESLRSDAETATLTGRTLDEIRRRTRHVTLADRLGDMTREAQAFWETELTAVEDRPITVGKIATALILFAAGVMLSRLLSRLLARFLRRRSVDDGAAAAFQGLAFYVLLLAFALIALRTVNIPLTAFTILGGAFAIGIGFGSQTIISNFISGLILLAERPIKLGDLIEVDGTFGRVERIGARSTRVRTFDNIHMIVPNSVLLEANVTNWTLSDNLVRTRVEVGVAYGSPTREVETLLLQAAREHERILAQPEPFVLFRHFGDSSLIFELRFWLELSAATDRLRIESDLRHHIDALFRDSGITIAFPQRDLHLDAARPLPVQLVDPGKAPEA